MAAVTAAYIAPLTSASGHGRGVPPDALSTGSTLNEGRRWKAGEKWEEGEAVRRWDRHKNGDEDTITHPGFKRRLNSGPDDLRSEV